MKNGDCTYGVHQQRNPSHLRQVQREERRDPDTQGKDPAKTQPDQWREKGIWAHCPILWKGMPHPYGHINIV